MRAKEKMLENMIQRDLLLGALKSLLPKRRMCRTKIGNHGGVLQ